jgi:hypothetical protein
MHKVLSATVVAGCLFALGGCSRETNMAVGKVVADSYNASYKDGVVKNWQSKLDSDVRCSEFKSRFKAAGDLYDNAANGAFAMDMMKIWEDAKKAKCDLNT